MPQEVTINTGTRGVQPERFKAAMGSVCTPVSVVTALDRGRPHGTTVSAFCSLSLAPPMVSVALDRGSALLELLQVTPRFGLNVLSHIQHSLASKFAVKGDDKFDDVSWAVRCDAAYIIGSACWFACEVDQLVTGGDHTIVMARVLESDHADLPPLTYHRRGFGTNAPLMQTVV